MSTRGKVYLNHVSPTQDGLGSIYSFYFVWEGNTALQALSENAMFGNATPGGDFTITATKGILPLVEKEEYYIDLHKSPYKWDGHLVTATVKQTFRSVKDPKATNDQFRWTGNLDGDEVEGHANLAMSIANKYATNSLDEQDQWYMTVSLARPGRRNDEEIVLREFEVERAKKIEFGPGREQAKADYIASLEKKAAIARGESV